MPPALKNNQKVLDNRATQQSKGKVLSAASLGGVNGGAILNAALTWDSVSADVKNAFINPPNLGDYAIKVLVKSDTALYKFTQAENHAQDGLKHPSKETITPWWFPTEPFEKFDVGLRGVLRFAKNARVSATEYMRVIAAVNPDWDNALDKILQARLKTDVYGFWGQASQQPKGSTGKNLVGRIYQLWIPNLTDGNIQFVSIDTPENVATSLNI